jgi:hypothetical protein
MYDRARHLLFAHANNGSMACTAINCQLLFAYRPLNHTIVRLLMPVTMRITLSASASYVPL